MPATLNTSPDWGRAADDAAQLFNRYFRLDGVGGDAGADCAGVLERLQALAARRLAGFPQLRSRSGTKQLRPSSGAMVSRARNELYFMAGLSLPLTLYVGGGAALVFGGYRLMQPTAMELEPGGDSAPTSVAYERRTRSRRSIQELEPLHSQNLSHYAL